MNTKHPYSEQLDVQGRYEVGGKMISYTARFHRLWTRTGDLQSFK